MKRLLRILWHGALIAWVALVVTSLVREGNWIALGWALTAMMWMAAARSAQQVAERWQARHWEVVTEREELRARLREVER